MYSQFMTYSQKNIKLGKTL